MTQDDQEPQQLADDKYVLVTSATGMVGMSILKQLRDTPFKIRAGCYNQSKNLQRVQDLKPDHVALYDADKKDENLSNAFKDVRVAYLIPTGSQDRVQHVRRFCRLAKKHGVEYIILFSLLRSEKDDRDRTHWVSDYHQMENYVYECGVPFSIIKSALPYQMLNFFEIDISKGVLPLPLSDGHFSPVDMDDVSRLVKHLIIYKEHKKHTFYVTGPEMLSGQDIAAIASKQLNYSVKYLNIKPSDCVLLLLDSGLELWQANEYIQIFAAIAEERLGGRKHDILERVTGIDAFFAKNRERFLAGAPHTPKPVQTCKLM